MTLRPNRVLENNSLAHADCFAVDAPTGEHCAVVVARLTWQVSARGEARVALEPRPIRLTTLWRGSPGGTVHFPSDRLTAKLGTDVLLLGSAYPPPRSQGSPAPTELDVRFRIETGTRTLAKKLRVFGHRVFMKKWTGVAPGPAGAILEPVPLVYEFAEGGVDPDAIASKREHADNPVGVGYGSPAKLVGLEAYRIESLDGGAPAGFGPTTPQWPRRRALYGTTDDRYYRYRYPVAPADYDPRFTSDAHPELWSQEPLLGDEPVEVVGATPEGTFRFRLPRYAPRFDVTLDGEERSFTTHLDTFLVDLTDPDDRVVELTWRVCVPLPQKSERLGKIRVTNASELPTSFYPELRRRLDEHRHAKENLS